MAIWTDIQLNDYEHNKELASQFGFAFVGCMICAHKDGHPDSDVCQDCINSASAPPAPQIPQEWKDAVSSALKTMAMIQEVYGVELSKCINLLLDKDIAALRELVKP